MGKKKQSIKKKRRCEPSKATLGKLWMHSGNICAFCDSSGDCHEVLWVDDHEIPEGRVSHIEAAAASFLPLPPGQFFE
ncbi:MAG: hypothetical protein E4H14_16540 [Candidatus Thorarchaeota archaeon]|nr:MAG: hypothetical protein E4H14_16540 [Candidatus Thorarchaeota archaeon]